MRTISVKALLARIDSCDDAARLEHYGKASTYRVDRKISNGHHRIFVEGYLGGLFRVEVQAPGVWGYIGEREARVWAEEAARRASRRLDAIAEPMAV